MMHEKQRSIASLGMSLEILYCQNMLGSQHIFNDKSSPVVVELLFILLLDVFSRITTD